MAKLNLKKWILACGFNEITAMNILQLNAVVSDNAVMADDVAQADVGRAIEFLSKYITGTQTGEGLEIIKGTKKP